MKKLITLLLAAALFMPASAQRQKRDRFNHNNVEQYYGLRLGLSIASLSSDDVNFDMNSRTGLNFGAVYGLQLANSTPLWAEFGLLYTEKGGENTNFAGVVEINNIKYNYSQKVTTRLSYLQVPIVVKYAFDLADDFYLQPFLGGYLALGVGGKTKEYGTTTANFEVERNSYSSYDYFKRFDGGLRVGCGIEYQMVYAEAGFDFGLANISDDDFNSTHTRNFFINVGVNF
jgi:hypothetical protein